MTISSSSRGPEARWAGNRNPWIICPLSHPEARLRLFCIPAAGEGPAAFRTWPERFFPHEVEVCLVHLPGRERRFHETPYTRLEPLLEALVSALSSWLDKPYAIYGHSMGAMIGFELARQLPKEQRKEHRHLIVSGYPAPHLERPASLVYTLPDAGLKEALRRFGGIPSAILDHQELLELLLPTLRADMTLCATYQYREAERLLCPVTVHGGVFDQTVNIETLAGWQQQTTATCSVRSFQGDHFFPHSHLPRVVQAILEDLGQSEGFSQLPHQEKIDEALPA